MSGDSTDKPAVDGELEAIEEPTASEQERREAELLAAALDGDAQKSTGQKSTGLDDALSSRTLRGRDSLRESSRDSADCAELLAAATMVQASFGRQQPLQQGRAAELVAEATETARAAPRRRRWRAARLVAMAACLVLVSVAVLTGVPLLRQSPEPIDAVAQSMTLSRPSNDLLGRPITDRAGAAKRLDRVFASRLAGYRTLTLAGR